MPRVDYGVNHYCKTCEIKYPLDVFRCIDPNGCGMKIRSVPRKQKRVKYIAPEIKYIHTKTDIINGMIRQKIQCKTTNPAKEVRY